MFNKCGVCGKGPVVKIDLPIDFDYDGAIITVNQIDEYCHMCGTSQKSIATIQENLMRITAAKGEHDSMLVQKSSFLGWLKWFFYDSRRCEHVPGGWKMLHFGMQKIKHCKKCGKCLEII